MMTSWTRPSTVGGRAAGAVWAALWLVGSVHTVAAAAPGEPRFVIQALGDRCWTAGPRTSDPVTIEPCTRTDAQLFSLREIADGTHDFQIATSSGANCVGIRGATGAALAPGQLLELQACTPTPGRRFAYDGDALLVGSQGRNERVSRQFVIEPLGENTNAGTLVVVGARDVDDAEFWRVTPFDVPGLAPHSGFVQADDELTLQFALEQATWGTVVELVPESGTIALDTVPLPLVVPEGVTVRGGRKFVDNGAEIWLPDSRRLFDPAATDAVTVLAPLSHTRLTAFRLRGHDASGDGAETFGVRIGASFDPALPTDPIQDVIVDHLDLSFWSQEAVRVIGPHGQDDRFVCNPELERDGTPVQRLIGNFFHHGEGHYGALVTEGGAMSLQGNLMYLFSHDVTSAFSNGSNRYFVTDGLFTGEDDEGTSAVLDVHGACDQGHWNGGRAGGLFESAFNSFFTPRTPNVSVRGTPCEQFAFHDNVSTAADDDETVNIELFPAGGPTGCIDTSTQQVFVAGDPDDVVVASNNRFDVVNPLASCGGTNADIDAPCSTGDFGVGDFDGDGRDDLFVGTGATWWFSSGGLAEWRFLNRMPQLASAVRLGDFDGDGRTDVVVAEGSALRVSWAGGSPLYTMNTLAAGLGVEDVAVGEFDGDGRADLFVADGVAWTFSSGANGPWQPFADSSYRISDLLFGDFVNNDGLTDVFGYEEGAWRVVDGPGGLWTYFGYAWTDDIGSLAVGDFNGNGADEIAEYRRAFGLPELWAGYWRVLYGGTLASVELGTEEQPLNELPIGDFTGSGHDAVLLWRNQRWLEIVTDLTTPALALDQVVASEPWSRQSMR